RLKGKRPIEVLLDKTTCPKRLTYDKIDTPTNVEVSTHLPTCTAGTAAAQPQPQAEQNTHGKSTKRAAQRAPSVGLRLRRPKRCAGHKGARDLAGGAYFLD
ncbi:MAG: hypothetical protein KKA59_08255, partial [Candidatus Omnitrophica bacterium]|nr:hypothetical protein [Candidatus Omnitrophota bacterium]